MFHKKKKNNSAQQPEPIKIKKKRKKFIEILTEKFLKKIYKSKTGRVILTIILLILLGFFLMKRFHKDTYPNDNIIEQAIEKIIENKTGMDIDLSPNNK